MARGRCRRRPRSGPPPSSSPRSRCTRPGVESDERLPREARVHGEHVHVVELGGQLGDVLDRRAGVDRQPGHAARGRGSRRAGGAGADRPRRARVIASAKRREEPDHLARARHHQVDVDRPPGRPDGAGERAPSVRPDGQVRHEVRVHHVDVDARSCRRRAARRAARRGAACRPTSATAAPPGGRAGRSRLAPGRRSRAMKNPSVPCRCGSVSRAPGRPRVGHAGVRRRQVVERGAHGAHDVLVLGRDQRAGRVDDPAPRAHQLEGARQQARPAGG